MSSLTPPTEPVVPAAEADCAPPACPPAAPEADAAPAADTAAAPADATTEAPAEPQPAVAEAPEASPAGEGEAAAPPAATAKDNRTPADAARELAELFPALFTPGQAKPLKLRIQADIQARAPGRFSKGLLSAVLHRHTNATGYLNALVQATHRHDLDGQPVDELTEEHRQVAREELARRKAVIDERKAQFRQKAREERQARIDLMREFDQAGQSPEAFAAAKSMAVEELNQRVSQGRQELAELRAAAKARRGAPGEGAGRGPGAGRHDGRHDGRPEGRPGAPRGAGPRPEGEAGGERRTRGPRVHDDR
ncbi:ProQ/FINO family protein, partial [Ideonella livida]